jgi:hypothetical protein
MTYLRKLSLNDLQDRERRVYGSSDLMICRIVMTYIRKLSLNDFQDRDDVLKEALT